jgi:hypothetical protein
VDSGTPTAPLGQLLLQRGLLTVEQLEVALAEHLATGKRLGEVLVDRGWVTREQIDDLLRTHADTDGARGIALLKTSMADAEAELEPVDESEADDGHPGHVLFVWSPSGYGLLSRAGEPPPVGSVVGVSGGHRVVTKIGPSPLPGDGRECAFLDAR